MKFSNATFSEPARNLAADEALLDLCDEEGIEALRIWESAIPFVVVGYANRISSEVNVRACAEQQVPVLRRCTGGGTVVQGPGCLNYALALRIRETGPLTTVTGTNQFVMERHRSALEELLGTPVSIQGHTDLAILPGNEADRGSTDPAAAWSKFSGNAQRRKRHALLFHGTILYAFNLEWIAQLLHSPSRQPDYRAARAHADFVVNVAATRHALEQTLRRAWQAADDGPLDLHDRITELMNGKYGRADWHERI